VLYLPTIVEAAESSPTAAREAAIIIRKQLDIKNNTTRPYVQYNAIMLSHILADNPGQTFTRNLSEPKFVGTVKELLRQGRDPSVRQILCETLEYFEVEKGYDEGLKGLREVWAKEKRNMAAVAKGPQTGGTAAGGAAGVWASPSQQQQPGALPGMEELVARISEAQTSAKLLEQVLQSTPQNEVPANDLVRVFPPPILPIYHAN
jgi:hypothetical protein